MPHPQRSPPTGSLHPEPTPTPSHLPLCPLHLIHSLHPIHCVSHTYCKSLHNIRHPTALADSSGLSGDLPVFLSFFSLSPQKDRCESAWGTWSQKKFHLPASAQRPFLTGLSILTHPASPLTCSPYSQPSGRQADKYVFTAVLPLGYSPTNLSPVSPAQRSQVSKISIHD